MRVVAGRWRGRKLTAGHGRRLRPTTDRVKEAVFSILGAELQEVEILDLCCGTGGLGIEALSRGAARAHFVDCDREALDLVRTNLERCGAGVTSYRLHRSDADRWLARFVKGSPDRPVVVLADPPYGSPLAQQLATTLLAAPGAFTLQCAVLEHASDFVWKLPEPCRYRWRRRWYGTTVLTILEA